jgi:hypothetical protein
VVKEVVWKKLVTLQGCYYTYSITWAVLWRTCSRAPAVVTKEYEWSLGGITEDTYVTLTYTNPDGTTGGLSDYYGALGSQYIFCARQNTATASHGIITLMGEGHQPAPAAPAPAPEPEPEPTPTTRGALTIATSAPTQAGGTINITGEPNESLNLAITMTYFDSVYFGSLDFAPQ